MRSVVLEPQKAESNEWGQLSFARFTYAVRVLVADSIIRGIGGLNNFLVRKDLSRLNEVVSNGDPEMFRSYMSNRMLIVGAMPSCIKNMAQGELEASYAAFVRKVAGRAKNFDRSSVNGRYQVYAGETQDEQNVGGSSKYALIAQVIPQGFPSLVAAQEYADKVSSLERLPHNVQVATSSEGKDGRILRITTHQSCKFQIDDPVAGKILRRGLPVLISKMIRAQVLHDFLMVNDVQVSSDTFIKLILPDNHPFNLLRSSEVRNVVEFSKHLRRNYSELSTLERVALIHDYGFNNKPISYFENLQDVLWSKIKVLARDTTGFDSPLSPVGEDKKTSVTPSPNELRAKIRALISETEWGCDLSETESKGLARSLSRYLAKHRMNLDELKGILDCANSSGQVVAYFANTNKELRNKKNVLDVPRPETQSQATPENETPDNVATAPNYYDKRMRRELNYVLKNGGHLYFNELISVLEYFSVTDDRSAGPGSHVGLKRVLPDGREISAQLSYKYGTTAKSHLKTRIIINLLKDLDLDPFDFVRKLAETRDICCRRPK
jgi:hypothetical protein